ncbi:LysR family transcriptional regulator [Myxococcus stipitatus]|uniref:LysR family transcriptional regulator n=1 Tax=Myxococcus stipitatus TaxID=83455 RepID=UPI0030CDCC2E
MDRFTQMAVFAKVVSSGSFSAAARHFQLTPAAVSKQIQVLEEWAGARLLERTTRRLSLTEAGASFHKRCARILEEVEEARSETSALHVSPRGQLRVSAPLTFGIQHLSPILSDYLAAYPEVTVDVSLNDRRVDLLEEGFDVAVRIGQLEDSSLISRRLTRNRFVVCASPAYLKRHGTPGRASELSQHSCVIYPPVSGKMSPRRRCRADDALGARAGRKQCRTRMHSKRRW